MRVCVGGGGVGVCMCMRVLPVATYMINAITVHAIKGNTLAVYTIAYGCRNEILSGGANREKGR